MGLRLIAKQLTRYVATECGRRLSLCGYFAAAVSDFYIPRESRPRHKIHSRSEVVDATELRTRADSRPIVVLQTDGSLLMRLEPVPKCLSLLISTWMPNALVVSFKVILGKVIRYIYRSFLSGFRRQHCPSLVVGWGWVQLGRALWSTVLDIG